MCRPLLTNRHAPLLASAFQAGLRKAEATDKETVLPPYTLKHLPAAACPICCP